VCDVLSTFKVCSIERQIVLS